MYLLSQNSHEENFSNIESLIEKCIYENKNRDLYFTPFIENTSFLIKIESKNNDNLSFIISCRNIDDFYLLISGLITASGLDFGFTKEQICSFVENFFQNRELKKDLIEKINLQF